MYLTKITKNSDDVYKVHQQVCALFENQKKLFHIGRSKVTVLSEKPLDESSKKVATDFKVGDEYKFKTVLNPIKMSCSKKKIVPLTDSNDIAKYVKKRILSAGVSLQACSISVDGVVKINKGESPISYNTVTVSGNLIVDDVEKFKYIITNGFAGKGRSFGFNMLNIF
jgi:CRISPR-associated protein Cas6/Cse3/CasE subtype I-E